MEQSRKKNESGNYHFICLECDFGVNVLSANTAAATQEALKRHDSHYEDMSIFKCNAEHYRLTGPDGIPEEF